MGKKILFSVLLLVSWKNSSQNEIRSDEEGTNYEEETFRLHCDEEVTLENLDNFEPFQETKHVDTAIIDSCSLLNSGSYAEVFIALNINISGIRALHLIENSKIDKYPELTRPSSQHFSGLDLKELQILNQDGPIAPAIDLNFLTSLKNLTTLTIKNYDILGPFPYTVKLEKVEISGGTLYGDIGSCQHFKVFHLTGVHVLGQKQEYRYNFFRDCTRIEELKLEHMNSYECKHSFLRGLSRTLRHLTVRHCELDIFPYSFSLFREKKGSYDKETDYFILNNLDVSHNKLNSPGFLATYKALETLDVSHNDLNSMFYLPKAVKLKLDYNNLEDYCDGKVQYKSFAGNEYYGRLPLKQLSASGTGLRALCFASLELPQLEVLNLTYNNITVLDYRQLYIVSGGYEVDLRDNPLEKVEFSQEDYEALKRDDPSVATWRKIRIVTNALLPCDCSHAWFTRAVSEKLLTIDGATCDDGSPLHPRISYGLQGCAAACEGTTGCSAANIINVMMNVKSYVLSIFAAHNTVWGIASQMYDNIFARYN